MTSSITYNAKNDEFFAAGRPDNQRSKKVVRKIAKRIIKYISENENVELTKLQKKCTKHVEKSDFSALSQEDMHIAHGVAINKIVESFVRYLNNPQKLSLKYANKFVDDILSTESSSDDKGRGTLKDFFIRVKKLENSSEVDDIKAVKKCLCKEANQILNILNKCSRNLIFGYAKTNQAVGNYYDTHLVNVEGKHHQYKEIAYSKEIYHSFMLFSKEKNYGAKQHGDNKEVILSSSVNNKSNNSYVKKLSNNNADPIFNYYRPK